MPLTPPTIDDRRFQDLVAEIKQRIPVYTPEWTNFNDSDPGMTLAKVFAWLTETILYRTNQLPDLNYIKFLELLNIQPNPALAAHAELTFKLKKLSDPKDPLVVLVPKNTQVAVKDPDLTAELLFETDRTLVALNAALAAVIVPESGNINPPKGGSHKVMVTEYNQDKVETSFPHPFYPFGKSLVNGATFLIGIMMRPNRKNPKNNDYSLDRFPAVELDLAAVVPQVWEENAEEEVIEGPQSVECLFPWEAQQAAGTITWEAYFGSQHDTQFELTNNAQVWKPLSVQDHTAGLSRSGHIYLEVPSGVSAVPFKDLSRSFWANLDLHRPPTSADELSDDIEDGNLDPDKLEEATWIDLGVTGSNLTILNTYLGDPITNKDNICTLIRSLSLNFTNVPVDTWLDASDWYTKSPFPYELSWFRARVKTPLPTVPLLGAPPQISNFLMNTVSATAAATRFEEVLGQSDGRPNQVFTLKRTPVLIDSSQSPPVPDLELVVRQAGLEETWLPVSDFYKAGPADTCFILDPQSGTLTFGDGVRGRIPVAGAQIVAARYRSGGGAIGNTGPDTITSLKSPVLNVDSVTNLRAAAGGSDAESLTEARLRAPHDLRHRDRAVTVEDFSDLALATPGVKIQRAYALARTRVSTTLSGGVKTYSLVNDTPGAVTLVILPENKEDRPQPSEDQLNLVSQHLNQHRLITTELYVIGPSYLELTSLEAEIYVSRQADIKSVQDTIQTALLTYFHPLKGGPDGRGWPFGRDVYFGEVYRQILAIQYVTRIQCLNIVSSSMGSCSNGKPDFIPINDGNLVYLAPSSIQLQVRYDPYA